MLAVAREPLAQVVFDLARNTIRYAEFLLDFGETRDDGGEFGVGLTVLEHGLGTGDEQIRHLRVGLAALAGCRDDDDAPVGVGLDDVEYFQDLPGICYRGPAEFCHFHCLLHSPVSKDWKGHQAFFPSLGKANRSLFQALEKQAAPISKPWKAAGNIAGYPCARQPLLRTPRVRQSLRYAGGRSARR